MPLTTSLFVPGRIKSTSHVLVDVGTGFYVGKSLDDASAILEKKVRLFPTCGPCDSAERLFHQIALPWYGWRWRIALSVTRV